MRGTIHKLLLAALIVVIGVASAAAPARAADNPPAYLAEYRAYNDALSGGDKSAAAAHAFAAWKAAEDALGDHKTTAVLAYNYGQLVLFDDPQAALPALVRAKDLQDAGIAALPPLDLAMYIAYAKFEVNGRKASQAESLGAALLNREASGAAASYQSSRAWLNLAMYWINALKYRKAQESGAHAEASIAKAIPDDYRARAQAIMIQGAASLLPINRFVSDIEEAHADFTRARRLFPPQKDIDTFDPILAKLIAWDYATHAALYSSRKRYRAEEIEKGWPEPPIFDPDEVTHGCTLNWKTRIPPEYPSKSVDKNYIGAVLIGYNLTDDGHVRDARILAEVPASSAFGEAALKSMRRWQMEAPVDPRPECRSNLLTNFNFVIAP